MVICGLSTRVRIVLLHFVFRELALIFLYVDLYRYSLLCVFELSFPISRGLKIMLFFWASKVVGVGAGRD